VQLGGRAEAVLVAVESTSFWPVGGGRLGRRPAPARARRRARPRAPPRAPARAAARAARAGGARARRRARRRARPARRRAPTRRRGVASAAAPLPPPTCSVLGYTLIAAGEGAGRAMRR
jgi:hypothetical protein